MSVVLVEKASFASKSGEKKWWCKVLVVDFNKVQNSRSEQLDLQQHAMLTYSELLHAVAGVCSVSLPDMELPAIYNSLTGDGCKTIIVLASPQEVLTHRTKLRDHTPIKTTPTKTTSTSTDHDVDVDDDDNPFSGVFSDDQSTDDSEEGDGDTEDAFAKDRELFLSQVGQRRSHKNQQSVDSVGAEHCVLGCASVMRLSSKPSKKSVQVNLLAVRRRCRGLGIGRQLMQCVKDPVVVGHYNSLLAFVDHKAEGFFIRHGFTEDPILTAKYRSVVEQWENSTLMNFVPPFSEGGLAVGSLKSLAHFQEHYKNWRDGAISSYSSQLEMMERLKHELLLLHTKIQSQEDVISVLTQQVTDLKMGKLTIETEFEQYRKHSQRLLRDAAVDNAEKWIKLPNTNST